MIDLINAVRDMATTCKLQNCEQIVEAHGAIGAVRMIQAEYLELRNRYLAARKELERFRWRPIAEIHEDQGQCVLLNIEDTGGLEIGNCTSLWFDEVDWDYFAQIPMLGQEEYERLRDQVLAKKLEDMEELEQMCEDRERES